MIKWKFILTVLMAVCLLALSLFMEARVTAVTATVNPAEFAGPCLANFNFQVLHYYI